MNFDTTDSKRSVRSIVPHIKDHYDYLTKIIIIGSSGTGKSAILHRFIKGDYNVLSSQTIGVEFSSKIIEIQDIMVKLQLWDTAGQERFRSLTRSYYRGSAGVVLCYDLSRKETLDELYEFVQDVKALTMNASMVIVGNKSDLKTQEIGEFEIDQLLNKIDEELGEKIPHIQTSALTGENIDEIFITLTNIIIRKVDMGEIDPDNQNFGVQYGDLLPQYGIGIDNYNNNTNTLNSSRFYTLKNKPRNIIKRKATTLSLIDRTLENKNTCSC